MNAGNWSRMVAGVLCATWTAAPVLAEDGVFPFWEPPADCQPIWRIDFVDQVEFSIGRVTSDDECRFLVTYQCDGQSAVTNPTAAFSSAKGYIIGRNMQSTDWMRTELNSDFTPRLNPSTMEMTPLILQEAFRNGQTNSIGENNTGHITEQSRTTFEFSIRDVEIATTIDGVTIYSAEFEFRMVIRLSRQVGDPTVVSEIEDIYIADLLGGIALPASPTAITPATSPDFTLAPLPQCLETE